MGDKCKNLISLINDYKKYILTIAIILLILGGAYVFNNIISNSSVPKEELVTNTGTEEREEIDVVGLQDSGDFAKIIEFYETKGLESLTKEEKIELVKQYLNEGNYKYNEKANSIKSLKLLNIIGEETFEILYLKGYSYEIVKKYDLALTTYEKAKAIEGITTDEEAMILNQIGHLYDLQGEIEVAYRNYYDSYALNQNISSSINIGRYLVRKGQIKESIPYFEYGLQGASKVFKSEIYFTLSSIYIELGDFEKSIYNAKKSIELYSDYPMGYYVYAKGLYMMNNKEDVEKIKELLDKSISLYENNSNAYGLYALVEFEYGDKTKSGEYTQKAIDTADKDMLLMENERDIMKLKFFELSSFIYKYDSFITEKDVEDYISNSLVGNSSLYFQLKRNNRGLLGKFSKLSIEK